MRTTNFLFLFGIIILTPSILHSKIIEKCKFCHNMSSFKNIPIISGQKPHYIISQIKNYENLLRQHPIMMHQLKGISNNQINRVARYFSELPCRNGKMVQYPIPSPPAAKNCVTCHGKTGIGNTIGIPNLAGQKFGYLLHEMGAFRSSASRYHPVMTPILQNLEAEEIFQLAKYYSELNCDPYPPY